MDKLPDEIVENIFSKLTVFDIVRAGCSCTLLRAFVSSHSSICSPSTVSLLLSAHPFYSSFVICSYDAARDAWLKLSLAFLRPSLPESACPVASAGGLICLGSGRDFVICNPISRSWRKLPSIPCILHMEAKRRFHVRFHKDSVEAFGLMCDSITGTYDFFIIHQSPWEPGKGSILMQYSSSLSQWRGLQPLLMSQYTLWNNLRSNTIISCNSRLYTLWNKGTSLVVLEYSDNIWTEIESPDSTATSGSASLLLNAFLMDISGSLHMVGVVGVLWGCKRRLTSVHIWKLHADSNKWMEVTCMPSSILQEFHTRIGLFELQCLGKNGAIYMRSCESDVLMFDLGKIEWKWLKDMEMVSNLGCLIFEPSLSAAV